MRGLKKKMYLEEQGITLIALVISIIVMLILAGVSLNATIGENGIVTQAQKSGIMQRYAKYLEELEMSLTDGVTCTEEDMRQYVPSLEDGDLQKFIIAGGRLAYVGGNDLERESAKAVGIDTELSENGSVQDVLNIVDGILTQGLGVEFPENDDASLPVEVPGKRLYDKNGQNGERWDIVVTYDSSNKSTGKYGSGYFLLLAKKRDAEGNILEENNVYQITDKEGQTKDITLSGDYILDYKNQRLIGLTNYKNWNLKSTLAVNEGLVLNIDPTNLDGIDELQDADAEDYKEVTEGKWTGIKRHGDVKYDAENMALKFNENGGENASMGGTGYIELKKSGVDFSNGFSFEIFANLSRLRYSNGSQWSSSGLFCRMPTLQSAYTQSLRFGFTIDGTICKFNSSSSWSGTGNVLKTDGSVYSSSCGYDVGKPFYLTFVYTAYDSTKDEAYQALHYDETMKTNSVDKVEYYVDGELFGYTYYGHDSYKNGLKTWNNDTCPFYLGVCPWSANGNLYYLKGSVYTCRLYTCSMTKDQVEKNRNATEQYRNTPELFK